MEKETVKFKQFLKKTAYWTIPPGIQSVLRPILAKIRRHHAVTPTMEAHFARNAKFRGIHKGKRCFVLATGPSINKQDLRPLRNEICIAVSMFGLHNNIKEIDPEYHVDPPMHQPFGFETIQKNIDSYCKCYSDRATFFFGYTPYRYSWFNFLEQNPKYNRGNIYHLNYSYAQPVDETNYDNPKLWDICGPLLGARTVIYTAMQIAAYMGFKDIYLLGCDHDYLTDINRGRTAYFYTDEEGIDDSSLWISTEEFFLAYYLRWKQYRLMQEYLKSRDCQIYNATEGGLLDVFPRVNLAQALAGDHERRNV